MSTLYLFGSVMFFALFMEDPCILCHLHTNFKGVTELTTQLISLLIKFEAHCRFQWVREFIYPYIRIGN
jgi:hypothetical protein